MIGAGCGLNHSNELLLGALAKEGVLGKELVSQDPDELHGLRVGEPVIFLKEGMPCFIGLSGE